MTFARPEKVEKRVRLDAQGMQEAILRFMSQPQNAYVTISRLANALNQPSAGVSEMVKILCNKQEEGSNKGLYGLKPEYALATDSADVSITGMSGGGAGGSFQQQGIGLNNPRTSPMYGVKQEGMVKRE